MISGFGTAVFVFITFLADLKYRSFVRFAASCSLGPKLTFVAL